MVLHETVGRMAGWWKLFILKDSIENGIFCAIHLKTFVDRAAGLSIYFLCLSQGVVYETVVFSR